MTEQEILQLEQKVSELTAWKDERIKERIKYPLDLSSRIALDVGLFVFTGRFIGLDYIDLITNSMALAYEIKVNNATLSIFPYTSLPNVIVTLPISQFTVNVSTDTLTNVSGQHNMNNGTRVTLTSDGTGMPTPLNLNVIYYIVNQTATTFQLSLTSGGSPINITFDPGDTYYYAQLP